jgi:hypothetical protein
LFRSATVPLSATIDPIQWQSRLDLAINAMLDCATIFFAGKQGNFLKNTIGLAVLAVWLVACASNQSADSMDGASTDESSAETEEKVCKYETGGRIGSKMRRVCRSVD